MACRLTIALILSSVCLAAPAWAGVEEAADAIDRSDYATALKELQPLADEGQREAQYLVGTFYYGGLGVPQDYQKAMQWFQLAAEQGMPMARYTLGTMYAMGRGTTPDNKLAIKWFRPAAEQGHALSMAGLGSMYEYGKGVPQDYVLAHMWFNLAGASGDNDSLEIRDSIAYKMTPAQIAEAQRLAREWKPKTP